MIFDNPPGASRAHGEPSTVQRAGNRFGVAAVVFGLLSVLCLGFSDLQPAAWAFAPMGTVLGGTGLALWFRGEATNRDDALIGVGLSYLVVMVLVCRLAAAFMLPALTAPLP